MKTIDQTTKAECPTCSFLQLPSAAKPGRSFDVA